MLFAERQIVLAVALDRIHEAVYLIAEDGRILYVNEAACRMLGYTRAELCAMSVPDIAPPLARESWSEHWRGMGERGGGEIETVHRTRDGRLVPVEIRATPFDHGGRNYHVTLVRDISERRRAETLAASEREFRTLAENLPDNIARYDVEGRTTYVNAQLERTLGKTREEVLGLRPRDNNPPGSDLYDEYQTCLDRVLASGEPETVELAYDTPLGRVHHQVSMIAERDEQGRVIGAVTLGRDLTERYRYLGQIDAARLDAERAARDLAQARDAAVEAARAKSDFLANMSHEIRTPMNGVLGLADLLLHEDLTPGARELAEGIQRSGVALLEILNDILDLSKLEAGRVKLAEEPFDLRVLLSDVTRLMVPRAELQGLRLFHEIEPGLPTHWYGDAGRLRQVLLNLVGNAVKFTSEGHVALRATRAETGELVLAVEDTGIGIPADRLDAVFEIFTQADGSITRRFGGTGLGLSISRQLVEMMSGRIRLASEPGRGSTFACHLPLRPAETPSAMMPRPEPAAVDLEPLSLRVLLVEDHAINRLVATRVLRQWHCEVITAEDGQQALERLEGERFDVVLMDVQMPVMDGLTAARRWREIERERGGHVPLVALTAHAMGGDRERCLDAGMDGYASKPLRPAELHATIREVLGAGDTQEREAA